MGRWVISLSGERGKGPWVGKGGGGLNPTANLREADVTHIASLAGSWRDSAVYQGHRGAKVFRLVRRERHTAEERAVVEAAMAWEVADVAYEDNLDDDRESPLRNTELATRYRALQACAALRAKRGG
jgi:hypothetical protein